MFSRIGALSLCALFAAFCAGGARAEFKKGESAPAIKATDINGKEVDLDSIVQQERDLVILFFFSPQTGEAMAKKLWSLDQRYGGKELEIIALGMKEDEAALKAFADSLKISYYVINSANIGQSDWLTQVNTLPTTLFVIPNADKTIERVILGGGAADANAITKVAEYLFRQQKLDSAAAIADEAKASGEDAAGAGAVKAHILTEQGKLDEAEKEFEALDSKAGLALVAKERGDFEGAVKLADEAGNDALAKTVKGEALQEQGQKEAAAEVLQEATQAPAAADWQKSDALNASGRAQQELGKRDEAIQQYQQAVELDPLNVIALSNESAVHRETGTPEALAKAEQLLEQATSIRETDQFVAILQQQIQRELQQANDLERQKLITENIKDLGERIRVMRQEGTSASILDPWSSRPLVLALFPDPAGSTAFFERAGTEVVLQRELESQLQTSGAVGVVEREMLDKLLQELNLGSSELASADTQRSLGQVLSAGTLGFVQFARMGNQKLMYIRGINSETSGVEFTVSKPVNEENPLETVEQLKAELVDKLTTKRELKGVIADASDEQNVFINLGAKHGVKVGQEFTVLEEGPGKKVGGKTLPGVQKPVAKLQVISVEPDSAICTLSNKREGATIGPETKFKGTI